MPRSASLEPLHPAEQARVRDVALDHELELVGAAEPLVHDPRRAHRHRPCLK